jgi:hypothetical protein
LEVNTNIPNNAERPVTDSAPPDTVQGIPTAAIVEELQRVLASVPFRRSKRLRHFLEFTVNRALRGEVDGLKEYSIGVEVFGKPETFDPRLDSIVRVEARRLRAAVERHYFTDGAESEIVILLRPGTYAPIFRKRSSLTTMERIGQPRSSQMLVLVGDTTALENIRENLSEKVGLVQAKAGRAAMENVAGLDAIRAMCGEMGVPVFYVGTSEQTAEPATSMRAGEDITPPPRTQLHYGLQARNDIVTRLRGILSHLQQNLRIPPFRKQLRAPFAPANNCDSPL